MDVEVWKPVAEPGYEGLYEVSSQGRVRAKARTIRASNRVVNYKQRLLKQNLDSNCYPQVVLCKETKRKTKSVHKLVLEAFIGPAPAGQVAMHRNSVPYDCRLENLEYGTYSENTREAIRVGTHNRSDDYAPIDWKARRKEGRETLNKRLASLEAA